MLRPVKNLSRALKNFYSFSLRVHFKWTNISSQKYAKSISFSFKQYSFAYAPNNFWSFQRVLNQRSLSVLSQAPRLSMFLTTITASLDASSWTNGAKLSGLARAIKPDQRRRGGTIIPMDLRERASLNPGRSRDAKPASHPDEPRTRRDRFRGLWITRGWLASRRTTTE